MIFKFNIGEVPKSISHLFMINRFFHNHNTISGGYLHTPLGRGEASYRTYSYIALIFGIICHKMYQSIFHIQNLIFSQILYSK